MHAQTLPQGISKEVGHNLHTHIHRGNFLLGFGTLRPNANELGMYLFPCTLAEGLCEPPAMITMCDSCFPAEQGWEDSVEGSQEVCDVQSLQRGITDPSHSKTKQGWERRVMWHQPVAAAVALAGCNAAPGHCSAGQG